MQNLPNPFAQEHRRYLADEAPKTIGNGMSMPANALPAKIPPRTTTESGTPNLFAAKLSDKAPKDFGHFLQAPAGMKPMGDAIHDISQKDDALAQSFTLDKAAQAYPGGALGFQQAMNAGPQIPDDTLTLRNTAGTDEFGNDKFTQQNTLPYFKQTQYQPDKQKQTAFNNSMRLQDRRMDAIDDFNSGKFSGAAGATVNALTERKAPMLSPQSTIGGNMSDYKAGKLANDAARLGQQQTQHEDNLNIRRQELAHKKQLEKAQQQNQQSQYNNTLRRQKVADAFKQFHEGMKANQPDYHKVGGMLAKTQGGNAELVSPENMLGLNPQQSQMMGAIMNAKEPEQANAMAQKYGISPAMINMYRQYTGAM